MDSLFDAPTPVGSSRVKGAHVLLRQIRRLVIRAAKTLQGRRLSADERAWCGSVHDTLRTLALAGDHVVPPRSDPQFDRKVRKRR